VLEWLFNPLIKSLRGLQQTSDMAKVRKRLGVSCSSLGLLSESVAIFEPEPLTQIAVERTHKLPDVRQGRFDVVGQPQPAGRFQHAATTRNARTRWELASTDDSTCRAVQDRRMRCFS
jgi:hypothetical protein